jgi:hypothetical protein
MNRQRRFFLGAISTGVAVIITLKVAEPTPKKWQPLPTMTSYPVNDISYQFETAGGSTEPQIFPDIEVDAVNFGEMIVETGFPIWLRFSAQIDSETVQIESVNLVFRFTNGFDQLTVGAVVDDKNGKKLWIVTQTASDIGLPPWGTFDFSWCVNKLQGEAICTPYQHTQYWDSDQVWFRVENSHAILYWYGLDEGQCDYIAREFTYLVAITERRWFDGFGQTLSYKPIIVLYPDLSAISQKFRILEGNKLMLVSSLHGVVSIVIPPDDYLDTCPFLSATRTPEWKVDFSITSMLAGMTRLIIAETLGSPDGCTLKDGFFCVNGGPQLWMDGQATWFASGLGTYDEQIRLEAPNLTVSAADECLSANAYRGASFLNWLVTVYGINTHRQIVELMQYTEDGTLGMNFEDAIRQVIGKPFTELESDWRNYLEIPVTDKWWSPAEV